MNKIQKLTQHHVDNYHKITELNKQITKIEERLEELKETSKIDMTAEQYIEYMNLDSFKDMKFKEKGKYTDTQIINTSRGSIFHQVASVIYEELEEHDDLIIAGERFVKSVINNKKEYIQEQEDQYNVTFNNVFEAIYEKYDECILYFKKGPKF